mmetsp:Transcript_7418/g.19420  ORF Transcript_7418/g.19420 Transcript_7418/m.19420 type:complete len:1140 (+) Transcript_7418:144-3563(+)
MSEADVDGMEPSAHSIKGKSHVGTQTLFNGIEDFDGVSDTLTVDSTQLYSNSRSRFILFVALSILSLGLLPLFCYFFSPTFYTVLSRKHVHRPPDAHWVLLSYGLQGKLREAVVQLVHIPRHKIASLLDDVVDTEPYVYIFEWAHLRYKFNHNSGKFDLHNSDLAPCTVQEITEMHSGRSSAQVQDLLTLYGLNSVDVQVDKWYTFLIQKCLQPFYILLCVSAGLWIYFAYYAQAAIVIGLISASVAWEIYMAYSSQRRVKSLFKTAGHIRALRDNAEVRLPVEQLVIGDIVFPDEGQLVPCDIAILRGECVVDESSRTGEVTPVVKRFLSSAAIGHQLYFPLAFKDSSLFSGGTILHLKKTEDLSEPLVGVVFSTGFSTTQGLMFREILQAKALNWKKLHESFLIFLIFGIIAFVGLIYPVIYAVDIGIPTDDIAFALLRVLARVFPPYLPIVLTFSAVWSTHLMMKQGIITLDPERINIAGWIETACFDKTGTLTNAELKFSQVNRVNLKSEPPSFVGIENVLSVGPNTDLEQCLATCHGCYALNGVPVGNAADVEGLRAANWAIAEDNLGVTEALFVVCPLDDLAGKEPLIVVTQYAFESETRRQSVLVEGYTTLNKFVFAKGSPEQITKICVPETVPQNLKDLVVEYSNQGFYVLACASRAAAPEWGIGAVPTRSEMESDLSFLGLVLFRGSISSHTRETIDPLEAAKIRTVIVTGDSPFSGVYVGRNGGLFNHSDKVFLIERDPKKNSDIRAVDMDSGDVVASEWMSIPPLYEKGGVQLAITGEAVGIAGRDLSNEEILFLLDHVKVYARMKPLQKSWLIKGLRSRGMYVGMCGDGANDCGALREADASLALSKAEASLVATFTSLNLRVSDFVTIIREGRKALHASSASVRFLMLYTTLLLCSNVYMSLNFASPYRTDLVYDDLAVVLPLALGMQLTPAATKLSRLRPPESILSFEYILSFLGQAVLGVLVQVIVGKIAYGMVWWCDAETVLRALRQFPPVQRCYYFDVRDEDNFVSSLLAYAYEVNVFWNLAHFQYISVAIALNSISEHRAPLIKNPILTAIVVLLWIACSVILMVPAPGISSAFNYPHFPTEGNLRGAIYGMVWGHLFMAILWEGFVYFVMKWRTTKRSDR